MDFILFEVLIFFCTLVQIFQIGNQLLRAWLGIHWRKFFFFLFLLSVWGAKARCNFICFWLVMQLCFSYIVWFGFCSLASWNQLLVLLYICFLILLSCFLLLSFCRAPNIWLRWSHGSLACSLCGISVGPTKPTQVLKMNCLLSFFIYNYLAFGVDGNIV